MLKRKALFFLGLGLISLMCMGCGRSTSQVTFTVKSVSAKEDGSFVTNCCNFTVRPKAIFIVLGDIHLLKEAPQTNPQAFDSLTPLLTPGQEEPPPDDIGKEGKYPGLWAINITKDASPHLYPTGMVDAGTWSQLQVRMAPAGSGVRGKTSNPAIDGHTLLFEGTATKDKLVCNFRMRLSFELGVGQTIQFEVLPNYIYRNTIEIDYSTWLDDVPFQTICPTDPTQTLDVTNTSHSEVIGNIRNAIPKTIKLTIGAGTAQ